MVKTFAYHTPDQACVEKVQDMMREDTRALPRDRYVDGDPRTFQQAMGKGIPRTPAMDEESVRKQGQGVGVYRSGEMVPMDAGMDPTTSAGGVMGELGRLTHAIQRIEERVNDLANLLSPVLRPIGECDTVPGKEVNQTTCHVASELARLTEWVSALNVRMVQLGDSINL